MMIKFTMNNDMGKRVQEILVKNEALVDDKTYLVAACEREGDPDDVICRIKDVKNTKRAGVNLHEIMEEYLAKFSPVSPKIEGRAVATDAPSTLLSQVLGVNYQFR